LKDRQTTGSHNWFNPGDSVIVAPDGEVVAGPLHEEHGILLAECDPSRARAARRTLDVAGHYSRPDVFRLEVRGEAMGPVHFSDPDGPIAEAATLLTPAE